MFSELVKPIDTLINRSCDGVGGFLKPWQMKRIARAEIEIAQLKAQAELDGNGLLVEAQKLVIYEVIQKQANMHNIKIEALNNLENEQDLNDISEDFLNDFVDKASKFSDETLQQLWGKVLAGELKARGSFSRRTLDFIGTLSVKEANDIYDLFNGLMLFNGEPELIIGRSLIGLYSRLDIQVDFPTQETYTHLENIGLFHTSKPIEVNLYKSKANEKNIGCLSNVIVSLDKKIVLDIEYDFSSAASKDVQPFVVTKTPLTLLGRELAQIARPSPSRKAIKMVAGELANENLFFKFHPRRYRA